MTLYEKSLFDIATGENLSYQDKICQIMLQCVCGIENIHRKFVIHRDIKPHNIMFKDGFLYFIDFGLSTFYMNDKREHISDENAGADSVGTPKWMSYYIHGGHRASRRDDLISLGYIFLFLSRGGTLPWDEDQGRAKKKELYSLISEINDDILCNYFQLCYALDFTEEPDYYALKDILKNNIKE
jgi:serine/threonine protein kinase